MGRKVPFNWYTSRCIEQGGMSIIQHVQDVEPIIESNKKMMNDHSDWRPYAGHKSDFKLVARIPAVEAMKLHAKHDFLGPNPDKKALKATLNSPEYKFFRTAPGKI